MRKEWEMRRKEREKMMKPFPHGLPLRRRNWRVTTTSEEKRGGKEDGERGCSEEWKKRKGEEQIVSESGEDSAKDGEKVAKIASTQITQDSQ